MSISSLSSLRGISRMQDQLASTLASSSVLIETASRVKSEVEHLSKPTGGRASHEGPRDPAALRAAIDMQLASDVQSGTLSQGDAARIGAALDRFEANMKAGSGAGDTQGPRTSGRPGGPPPGGGAGGPPPGGGAGGGPGGPPPMEGDGATPGATASASVATSALDELLKALEELKSESSEDDTSSAGSTLISAATTKTDLASYLGNLLKSGKVDLSV